MGNSPAPTSASVPAPALASSQPALGNWAKQIHSGLQPHLLPELISVVVQYFGSAPITGIEVSCILSCLVSIGFGAEC
jgi:hypothetical protein